MNSACIGILDNDQRSGYSIIWAMNYIYLILHIDIQFILKKKISVLTISFSIN